MLLHQTVCIMVLYCSKKDDNSKLFTRVKIVNIVFVSVAISESFSPAVSALPGSEFPHEYVCQ